MTQLQRIVLPTIHPWYFMTIKTLEYKCLKSRNPHLRNWHKNGCVSLQTGKKYWKSPYRYSPKWIMRKQPWWKYPKPSVCQKPDWCIISHSSRICSWLLWTNMYFIPSSRIKFPIYSRFVPGVYRPVLRPCDFCPNTAQTCLRYP